MAYKQGFFTPRNPFKYKGDITNIVYRSGWEKRVYDWCDTSPHVIRWSSEEIIIPYISPLDNRYHRYFPDVWAEMKTKDGIKTFLIEVKPKMQTIEPKPKKRKTKGYITEVTTWAVNNAKWEYAKKYCEEKGWEFFLLTEEQIFGKKRKSV